MDKKNESFKPYISADKVLPEFTVTSILMGIILAVVFGAANAYLGLKVGMTVSASIPAAVISLGVIRVIMKKNSILESNMVQTIGSAGESLAAGAIFTMPALFLWAEEGKIAMPDRPVWWYPGCSVYDPAEKSTDRRRTRNPAVSGRNGMCRSSAGR